ncbi:MAG: VTT domain-containing protein [Candidatus Peribacteraceae bacterium]|jgi:membrane protein YqaA with SNARE-associated domain|nr:VTT domain-containing protein [Candidatus Peribacteraceae bacterium]MDD5740010.1 VTT domain-containing protein [Candidatus Peribacteraceae bacterium]
MRLRRKKTALYLVPLLMFLAWTVFIYQFPPADIVTYVGMKNGYLATLCIAFIGGLSVLISIPYHLVIMTFAAGGLNPWLLGLAASIGQLGGDTTSYMLGFSGGSIASGRFAAAMDRFRNWVIRRPYRQMACALFVYGSISPISNDWMLVPMGLARYPYWRVMLPLELGNVVFNTTMALLGTYGLASVLGA